MNDDRLRALYSAAIARHQDRGEAEPVSLEAMVAVLERRGSEAERLRTMGLVLRDPRRREEFELLRAVVRAGAPARVTWYKRGVWRVAAAVVVVAGLGLLLSRQRTDPLRGGTEAMIMLQPADGVELTAPPTFVWHSMPGAVDYRLEVVDPTGAVVFEEQLADTVSTGPVSETFVPGERYLWSVTAFTTDVRTHRSDARAFTLRAP